MQAQHNRQTTAGKPLVLPAQLRYPSKAQRGFLADYDDDEDDDVEFWYNFLWWC